jgi:hypothetical protein
MQYEHTQRGGLFPVLSASVDNRTELTTKIPKEEKERKKRGRRAGMDN